MRVDFPYAKEKSQLSGPILRPVARVILNDRIPNMMYVDSGADVTLLPKSVGELIGLKREKGEKPTSVKGIGKSHINILIRHVTMTIGGSRFSARVAWSLIEDVPMLLGRLDVFSWFNILFRERKGIVTFYTEESTTTREPGRVVGRETYKQVLRDLDSLSWKRG